MPLGRPRALRLGGQLLAAPAAERRNRRTAGGVRARYSAFRYVMSVFRAPAAKLSSFRLRIIGPGLCSRHQIGMRLRQFPILGDKVRRRAPYALLTIFSS